MSAAPRSRRWPPGVVLALATLLAACGSARRSEPVAGPFHSEDPQVRRGEVVFNEYCHKCHTGGEAALGPGLFDKPLPKFLMKIQTRHGLGAMPGFDESRISDADLDALMDYIVARRGHGGS